MILTAFALAVVLYLQFGFDIKDWIKNSANKTSENSSPSSETDASSQP
jgi:hypothetical protein